MVKYLLQGVFNVKKNDDLEIARQILYNAYKMNFSKEIILKISQKIDQYVNEYYRHEKYKVQ